jgi:hypothetical protein
MKFLTSMPIGEFLDKLELPNDLRADVARRIRHHWSKGECVDFEVEVDKAEAFDAVEQAGMLPESDIYEVIEVDDLVDGVKALLGGDFPLATILFARALGGDTKPQRAVEEAIRAHQRRLAPAKPAATALAA